MHAIENARAARDMRLFYFNILTKTEKLLVIIRRRRLRLPFSHQFPRNVCRRRPCEPRHRRLDPPGSKVSRPIRHYRPSLCGRRADPRKYRVTAPLFSQTSAEFAVSLRHKPVVGAEWMNSLTRRCFPLANHTAAVTALPLAAPVLS